MSPYLTALTAQELWVENTRAVLAGNRTAVEETAAELLRRTDLSGADVDYAEARRGEQGVAA